MRTFAQSTVFLKDYLASQGWTVSQGLKVNHATRSDGWRVWFRPQAVWLGQSKEISAAHSLFLDTRTLDGPTFVVEIDRAIAVRKDPSL